MPEPEILSWDLADGFRIRTGPGIVTLRVELVRLNGELSVFEVPADHAGVVSFNVSDLDFPVTQIKMLMINGDGETASRFSIENLFPDGDVEFDRIFVRQAHRHESPEIQYFVADQVDKYFVGSANNKCSANVVKAYKAVELMDATKLASADRSLASALLLTSEIPVDWHPRRNRDHLLISLMCARWHVALAQEDYVGFRRALDEIEATARDGMVNWFTPAYNATTSLTVLVLYLQLVGDKSRSQSVARLVYEIFTWAVRDSDGTKTVLMKELSVSLANAIRAHEISESDFPVSSGQLESWFLKSTRLGPKSDQAQKSFLSHRFLDAVEEEASRSLSS